MSKPQSFISVQFGREWRIKRPYVYRYLDSEYVDRFFEDGSIRLGSFAQFSKHEDEERKDGGEGSGIVTHMNSEGEGQTMMAVMSQGDNAYVLCGTTRHDPQLQKAFQANSGFRINDTTAFANAISSHIPGFIAGTEGSCVYSPQKSVLRDLGRVEMDSFKDDTDSKNMSLNKLMQFFGSAAGDDLFFLKATRYAHQNEYRMLWFSRSKIDGYIDIKCPEAREFCTRLDPLDDKVEQGSGGSG